MSNCRIWNYPTVSYCGGGGGGGEGRQSHYYEVTLTPLHWWEPQMHLRQSTLVKEITYSKTQGLLCYCQNCKSRYYCFASGGCQIQLYNGQNDRFKVGCFRSTTLMGQPLLVGSNILVQESSTLCKKTQPEKINIGCPLSCPLALCKLWMRSDAVHYFIWLD